MAKKKKSQSSPAQEARRARSRELSTWKKKLRQDPSDEEVFVKLWDSFREAEAWPAMAEILAMRISALSDGPEKVRSLIKLGNLYEDKLGDSQRAIDAFQRALVIDPKNQRALSALADLYHDLEQWTKLIEIYLLRLELAETSEEKATLRARLAQIYEDRLRNDDQAFIEYIRAVRLAPQTARILAAMDRLAAQTESFRELLAVYEDVLTKIERPDLRVALYLKIARLYSEKLSDPQKAEHYLKQSVELARENPDLLLALGAIYGEEEEWSELIATYSQLIAYLPEQHLKNRLRREIARLYREGLRDSAAAFYELVRVARYSPEDPELLAELCRAGREAGRVQELAAVLEDMGPRLSQPEKIVELYTLLGKLHLEDLKQVELAYQAVEKAIAADPANVEVQRLRFDLLEARGEFALLAEALEAFLARPDLSEETIRSERRRLARILEEKLGNPDKAVALYRSSLDESPAPPSPQVPEQPDADSLRAEGRWSELLELLENQARECRDEKKLLELEREIAAVQLELGKSEPAFFALARCWRKAPQAVEILPQLVRAALQAGLSDEALLLLDDQAGRLSPSEAARVHLAAAELLYARGREDDALERLRLAARLEPNDAELRERFLQRLREKNDLQELAGAYMELAQQIEAVQDRVQYYLQAAEIFHYYLDDPLQAEEIYHRVLKLDQSNQTALQGLKLLESVAQAYQINDGPTIPEFVRSQKARDSLQVEEAAAENDAAPLPQVAEEPAEPQEQSDYPAEESASDKTPTLVGPAQAPPKPVPAQPTEECAQDQQKTFSEASQPLLADKVPTLVGPVASEAPPAVPAQPAASDEIAGGELEGEPYPPPDAPSSPAALEESASAQAPAPETPAEPATRQPPVGAAPDADSESWLRSQLDKRPDDVTLWENLSQLIFDRQGSQPAFDLLVEALQRLSDPAGRQRIFRRLAYYGQDYPQQVRLGCLLEAEGRLEDAESAFRAALRKNALGDEALDGLQRIYQTRGTPERFDAVLTRALRSASDARARRQLHLRRALLRARVLQKWNEAIEDLNLLAADDPTNLQVIELQEEIFQRTGNDELLAEAYQRHLQLVSEPARKLDLMLALAALYEKRLDDLEQAARLYRQALDMDRSNYGAYQALASLLEKQRDWLGAADLLKQAAENVCEPEELAQLHLRRGKILEEQLLRPEEAELAYRQALEGHVFMASAVEALLELARQRRDWVEVLRLLQLKLEAEERPPAKAEMLVEMAGIWKDQLQNPQKAMECYQLAHRLDPTNLEASRRLADERWQAKDLAGARPLLQQLAEIGAQGRLAPAEMAEICLRLAQTSEALGLDDDAQTAYRRALEIKLDSVEVLLAYGSFLVRKERWAESATVYQKILDDFSSRLDPPKLADIACLVARGLSQQGKVEQALEFYQKALRFLPAHQGALRAGVDLCRQLGRHQLQAEFLQRLLDLTGPTTSRLRLGLELGDLLTDQLGRPGQAAEVYLQASRLAPAETEVLEKLRRALILAERYQEAVEVIKKLAELAENDRQRSRYLRIAADILSERLDDDQQALELYLRALHYAPLDQRAQQAAVKILNRLRDWHRLAALQEKLLERLPPPVPGQPDRRVEILGELVELYRYRLNDRRRAMAACEQLLSLRPGDLKVREDLARLYEADGRLDDSLTLHRSLIQESPFSVDSYHALFRIYLQRRELDAALCLAAALAFLEEANADERKLLAEKRSSLLLPPGRTLGEQLYQKHLLAPGARGLTGELLAFASDYIRPLFSRPAEDFHLRARDRLSLQDRQHPLAQIFDQGIRLLGLPVPEIYLRGPQVKGVLALNTAPPAVVAAEDITRQFSIPEIRFLAGRALAFCRPENQLTLALGPVKLRNLLDALLELGQPQFATGNYDRETLDLAKRLDKLIPPLRREKLEQLASRYRREQSETAIRDWIEGVEQTCNRAGFLLAGDLEACIKVLKGGRVVSPSGSTRTLIRELIFFAISDDYFAIRRALLG